MKKHYYSYKALEEFICKLETEQNYNCIQTWEGCLGIGNWLLLSPDDKHYNFIIREEYVNSSASVHSMMKCGKLPKKYEEELNRFYEQDREQEEEVCLN